MIVGMFVSLNYLNKKCTYYGEVATKLEDTVNNESWEKAYDMSKDFLDQWKKDSKVISAFINHLQLDTINDSILKLTQYTKVHDKSESLAMIHDIKFFLEEILFLEKVTIENIF